MKISEDEPDLCAGDEIVLDRAPDAELRYANSPRAKTLRGESLVLREQECDVAAN